MRSSIRRAAACVAVLVLTGALQGAPATVTTTKRSAIAIGNGSFALVKGTKLDVVSREGDFLVVKFRASQGKIPVTDTDYPVDSPETPAAEPVATPAPAPVAASKPVPPPTAQPATPPALNTTGQGAQPATHYGQAVQKAKQASEAHKSTHVDPTKGIMEEEPKK